VLSPRASSLDLPVSPSALGADIAEVKLTASGPTPRPGCSPRSPTCTGRQAARRHPRPAGQRRRLTHRGSRLLGACARQSVGFASTETASARNHTGRHRRPAAPATGRSDRPRLCLRGRPPFMRRGQRPAHRSLVAPAPPATSPALASPYLLNDGSLLACPPRTKWSQRRDHRRQSASHRTTTPRHTQALSTGPTPPSTKHSACSPQTCSTERFKGGSAPEGAPASFRREKGLAPAADNCHLRPVRDHARGGRQSAIRSSRTKAWSERAVMRSAPADASKGRARARCPHMPCKPRRVVWRTNRGSGPRHRSRTGFGAKRGRPMTCISPWAPPLISRPQCFGFSFQSWGVWRTRAAMRRSRKPGREASICCNTPRSRHRCNHGYVGVNINGTNHLWRGSDPRPLVARTNTAVAASTAIGLAFRPLTTSQNFRRPCTVQLG